jgi:RNA polymerase sigma-70 factor (ECF subfamily)
LSIDDTQFSDAEISDDEFSSGKEERIQELEAALDLLNPDEKMLVHLYYYEDKPMKEIAFIMDAEPNVLTVRLHRIRKKLAEMIKTSFIS